MNCRSCEKRVINRWQKFSHVKTSEVMRGAEVRVGGQWKGLRINGLYISGEQKCSQGWKISGNYMENLKHCIEIMMLELRIIEIFISGNGMPRIRLWQHLAEEPRGQDHCGSSWRWHVRTFTEILNFPWISAWEGLKWVEGAWIKLREEGCHKDTQMTTRSKGRCS